MREKIVLIGAGSAMFTRGLLADIILDKMDVDLALVDIDAEALEVAERLSKKMIEGTGAPVTLSAAIERRDVLKDATAIITTIGVGGRRSWEQDILIPRKYGIYQPVGDSVMPGGTSRCLRMIPAMVEIAKDVMDLAPNALFFNYANPMGPICRAVRKATGANVVGLCIGVFGTGQYIAQTLGVDLARVHYTAVGMNHLTWFIEYKVDGMDAFPRLHEIAKQKLAAGTSRGQLQTTEDQRELGKSGDFLAAEMPFTWELFELFGAFPAPGDRHVMEFFPQFFADGKYCGKTAGVDVYDIMASIAWGDKIYQEMKEQAFSDKPLGDDFLRGPGGEHSQAVSILLSVRSNAGRVYSANLPNTGQVPNFPLQAVLEGPAIADNSGLLPIAQKPLPVGIVGTLATRLAWVETIVEAALEGSRQKFIQALLLDGFVNSMENATALADELLAAHAQHLPQCSKGCCCNH